jgi:hypothetical protein
MIKCDSFYSSYLQSSCGAWKQFEKVFNVILIYKYIYIFVYIYTRLDANSQLQICIANVDKTDRLEEKL